MQFGPYYIRPPPFLINFYGTLTLDLFWTEDTGVAPVGVRDIYALEFQIFKDPLWCFFYVFSVIIFMIHGCLGGKKVTPVLVAKRYISKVVLMGYAIFIVLCLVYLSFYGIRLMVYAAVGFIVPLLWALMLLLFIAFQLMVHSVVGPIVSLLWVQLMAYSLICFIVSLRWALMLFLLRAFPLMVYSVV